MKENQTIWKKGMKLLLALFVLIFLTFSLVYDLQPHEEDLTLQTIAITGIEAEGQPAVKISFSYRFNKKPIFTRKHSITVDLHDDWQVIRYNMEENGIYSDQEIRVSSPAFGEQIELPINPRINYDDKNTGEGYLILVPTNMKAVEKKVYSTVTVHYYFKGLVKEYRQTDSTAWENQFVK